MWTPEWDWRALIKIRAKTKRIRRWDWRAKPVFIEKKKIDFLLFYENRLGSPIPLTYPVGFSPNLSFCSPIPLREPLFCVPFMTFLDSLRSRNGPILERSEPKNVKIGTQKSGSLSGIGEQKLKFGLKPNGYVSGIGEPSLFS